VLRRRAAGGARVNPWDQEALALRLDPPGDPGVDRLELGFWINEAGQLMVESKDLITHQSEPPVNLGPVR